MNTNLIQPMSYNVARKEYYFKIYTNNLHYNSFYFFILLKLQINI